MKKAVETTIVKTLQENSLVLTDAFPMPEVVENALNKASPFSRTIGTRHKDHVQNLINKRIRHEIKKQDAKYERKKAREAAKRNPPPFNGPESLREFFKLKKNNPYKFLEKLRWPNGIYCPYCGYSEYKEIENNQYTCLSCFKKYDVKTNTPFDYKMPLELMFRAIMLENATQTGLTKMELASYLEIGETNAYHFLTDLRKFGYDQSLFDLHVLPRNTKQRIYEIDITYIDDGLNRNRHIENKLTATEIGHRKLKILTICLRGGFVRAFPLLDKKGIPIKTVTTDDIKYIILDNIPKDADIICTDGDNLFNFLSEYFPGCHFSVNHKENYSVLGIIHVQNAEGIHSLEQNQQYKHGKNVNPKNKIIYINGIIFKLNTKHLNNFLRFILVIINIFRNIESKTENAKVINMNANKILNNAA